MSRSRLGAFALAGATGLAFTAVVVLVLAALVFGSHDRVRIMPLGDSITAGYTDNPDWNVPFSFGYRSRLFELLTKNGCKFEFVGGSPEPWRSDYGTPKSVVGIDLRSVDQDHHRGYGGWRIARLSRWLPFWLVWDRPDVVLFMAGVNDIGANSPDETIRADLTKAVETIHWWRSDAKIFVGTATPAISDDPKTARINQFIANDLPGVKIVDQSSVFQGPDGKLRKESFANGINHPVKDVYDKMAENWFAAIKTTVCP